MASRTWSAMPVPAVPDPKITMRMSSSFNLLTWRPAIIAARVTHPVPWTSSLKQAISGVYLSRILRARKNQFRSEKCRLGLPLGKPKSSKWMYAFGYSFRADCTKVSTKSSYSLPRILFFFKPRYNSSLRSSSLSVPQSRTTGKVRFG